MLEAEDALLDVVEIDDVDVGVALVLVVNGDVVLEDWMMQSRAHLGYASVICCASLVNR